jgi:hypothetical protein
METTDRSPARGTGAQVWTRWVNVALGAWLAVSAFLWPHTGPSRANTVVVGASIALVALGAMTRTSLRAVNMMLAIWLFFSSLFLFHAEYAAEWHNAILALLVFAASMMPSRGEWVGRRPAPSMPPI